MRSCPFHNSPIDILVKRRYLRELVAEVPWLGHLDEPTAEDLLDSAQVQVAAQREWLFRQQESAHWLYVVISGGVRLVRMAGDGRLATIRCVERGGTLGELSMVSREGAYLYSAEALQRTHVLAIPTAHCREILENAPACRAEYMSRLALELTERLEDLALLTQADAMARLVSYLLRQLSSGRSKDPQVVRLTIPKYWLAAQLAMTPETLSRLLGRLRDLGLIRVERQQLVVLDDRRLRDLAMQDH
ncbi:Crp/Fnr family transcriptional regulator [Litchfieldella rifensis]|uniref:Crp/Fnr family transcriptional regulator n=1 Tax=Litchfieldella rifensis TaxID=762643 RepID=A0ABV7LIR4_9GAMM